MKPHLEFFPILLKKQVLKAITELISKTYYLFIHRIVPLKKLVKPEESSEVIVVRRFDEKKSPRKMKS